MPDNLPDLRELLAGLPIDPRSAVNAREGILLLPDPIFIGPEEGRLEGDGVLVDDILLYDTTAALCCGGINNITTDLLELGSSQDDVLSSKAAQTVLMGFSGNDRITGGSDDDVLFGGAGADRLVGGDGLDIFVMADDGAKDQIRDFEIGADLIDVSALGVEGIEDLTIETIVNRGGTPIWLSVSAPGEDNAFFLRFADDTPLEPASLTSESFLFTDFSVVPEVAPELVADSGSFDSIRLSDAAEVVQLSNDDIKDVLRGFDLERDKFDASDLDAESFGELEIAAIRRGGTGDVLWISLRDATGEDELFLRYAGDVPLEADLLSAEHFIFG